MPTPFPLNMYTLREATALNYAGPVKQVAAMGYAGVETANFAGTTVPAAARLFKDLGLTVCSAHLPLPLGERQAEVLETMRAFDCRRLICASQPRQEFETAQGIPRGADTRNPA